MTSIELDRELIAGKRLLCAVSGGADSMCLLHLLISEGFDVTAVHFEHGIRGEESRRDAAFVEGFCREHGIPFVTEHADVPAYAEAHGLGLEEAGRALRYAFFERAADALGCDKIVTAHTLDDLAETMLFNLARGSGPAGLCGIPRARGRIVRPMLNVSRAEVEAYLAEHGVPHVEDSTNRSDDYARNLIRHHAVPALKRINPRFAEAAARAAALCARDEDYFRAEAERFLAAHYRQDSLPLDALEALHPAVASRVVRALLPGLSSLHTDRVLAFLSGTEYALLELPGAVLRRECGRLYFAPAAEGSLPVRRVLPGEALPLPEAGLSLWAEKAVYAGEIHDLFKTSYLKYEMIGSDLFCTGRMPGDRLRPPGRGCTKTLKALFSEHALPRAARDLTPVIRCASGPLWVYGLALDERALPRPGDPVWKLTFSEIQTGVDTEL